MLRIIWLWIEFTLLFFALPVFILLDKSVIHPSIFVLPALLFIILYLRKNKTFRFRELVEWPTKKEILIKYLRLLIPISIALLAFAYFLSPDDLFNLPKSNLRIWIFLIIFYPFFSAYGQEVIFRVFQFYRYQDIYKNQSGFVWHSAISFSFVHIIYFSWISIILTLFLGIYLSIVYWNTKSVSLSTTIHGFLGDLVFTVGLGEYFWLDIHKYL